VKDDPATDEAVRRETEEWFVQHGLPQFMRGYARKQSVLVALPLLLVVVAFAFNALPWLDERLREALLTALALAAFALWLVPPVRFAIGGYRDTPSLWKVAVWLVVGVGIIVVLARPEVVVPWGWDAMWFNTACLLIMLVVAARLYRRAPDGAPDSRPRLRATLLVFLFASTLIFAVEGTRVAPSLSAGPFSDELEAVVPYWERHWVPDALLALPFALIALAMSLALPPCPAERPRLNRLDPLVPAAPLLALVFGVEVSLVPVFTREIGGFLFSVVLIVLALSCVWLWSNATRALDRVLPGANVLRRTVRERYAMVAAVVLMALAVVAGHSFLVYWLAMPEYLSGVSPEALARAVAIFDLGICILVGLVLAFGLDRIAIWALTEAPRNLGTIAIAVVRGLPVLLIFLAFFGVVEELWKIADREPVTTFMILAGFLIGITLIYLVLDAHQAVKRLARFESWDAVRRELKVPAPRRDTALDEALLRYVPRFGMPEQRGPTIAQHVNAITVMLVYEALVFLPVAIVAFGLFYGLGHLVVDAGLFYEPLESAIKNRDWSDRDFIERPWAKMALLMAAFAVLYLAVHVTAREQRELFLEAPDRALRRSLAMLVAYRRLPARAGERIELRILIRRPERAVQRGGAAPVRPQDGRRQVEGGAAPARG
jgi:hypothetical protein